MASGLPVIATAVGGNLELVTPGQSGSVFPAGDVVALTGLMREYAVDAARRKIEGQSARTVACSRFSLNAMVEAYQRVYAELLDRSTTPGL
jgi:glycosyltransferase involved in cell wall biosynthesis